MGEGNCSTFPSHSPTLTWPGLCLPQRDAPRLGFAVSSFLLAATSSSRTICRSHTHKYTPAQMLPLSSHHAI